MAPSPQRRAELGLDDRLTAVASRGVRANSPTGGPGVIFCQRSPDGAAPMMDMPNQKWQSGPDQKYYIGHSAKEPPTPDSTKREQIQRGENFKTKGGHTWHIPRIREWFDSGELAPVWSTNFPRMLSIDDENRLAPGRIVPEFESL
ncbi:MAG: hypothetical protein AAFQ57_16940, partial [Cyanobacteria bacterium J06626_14]